MVTGKPSSTGLVLVRMAMTGGVLLIVIVAVPVTFPGVAVASTVCV